MDQLNKRLFYSTSVLFAIVALVLHFVGRAQSEEGQHLKAARISAAFKQQIKYTPDPEAVHLSAEARLLNKIGLVFTFASLACVVMAMTRREQGAYSIPIMLLFFDALIQMIL